MKITNEELKVILDNHQKWLNHEVGGIRADLTGADLTGANLTRADLLHTSLTRAILIGADLTVANLTGADLTGADLTGAILIGAILIGASLTRAILIGADLTVANLAGADLTGADLIDVKFNENTSFYALQCCEKGSFIGFKKANDKIVELLITEDALRSSATSRKCRCSKAKVLSITSIDGIKEFKKAKSNFDNEFIYEVGKIVSVDNFDLNRWNECSTGIHFFITRQEAVNY